MTKQATGEGDNSSKRLFADAAADNEAGSRVEEGLLIFFAFWVIAYLYRASVKILWLDELFSYYTDQVPTVRDVIKVQNTSPIALDPPLSHIIQHLALVIGNGSLLVYRLPEFFFCCVMLLSVYIFLRRLGGVYLGAITVGILIMTPLIEQQFSSARPYALLLAATGLGLLLWQNCLRGVSRPTCLVGLFFVLGLGVATHYYGVLTPMPFLIAEAFRALKRRKLDLPVFAALFGSLIFALSWVSCIKAAKQYRLHYYVHESLSPAELYRGFFFPLHDMMTLKHGEHVKSLFLSAEHGLFLVFVCVVAFGLYVGYRGSSASTTLHTEWIAIGVLAFLPVFGVALSHLASGAHESRFTLEYSIGVATAISAALLFLARSRSLRNGLLLLLCLAVAVRAVVAVRSSLVRRAALSTYVTELNQSALRTSKEPIVFADFELFLLLNAHYGHAAPPLAVNMIWPYDLDRSIVWKTTDTTDRTMMNLGRFTKVQIVPYADFVRQNRHFEIFDSLPIDVGYSWLNEGFRADGAVLRPEATIHDPSDLIGNHLLSDVQLAGPAK